jgi:hypothetical protein
MAGDDKHIGMYSEIHAKEGWGNTSVKNLRYLRPAIKLLHPASILDYGCGQSPLLEHLNLGYDPEMLRYDPAIPKYSVKPEKKADLLLNIDVLEHIPESHLDEVIADMAACCSNAIIIVDMAPAATVLSDGTNAHCTLQPRDWWERKLSTHFGPLHPFPTLRSTRAGFCTWQRPASQAASYWFMRVAETLKHYLG